jgi:hypothetical protein
MRNWWIPWALSIALFGLMGSAPGIADSTIPTNLSWEKTVSITETTTRTSTSFQSTATRTTTTTKTVGDQTKTTTSTQSHTFTVPFR